MNENILKAEKLFQENRISEALDLYNQEILIAPKNALAYEGAAKCLFNLKYFDKAIDLSKKVLEIDPALATPHALLAEIYYHLNQIDKGWSEAKKAYEMDSNSFQVLMTYGTLLLIEHKPEEAISFLEKAAQISPNSYIVHHNLLQAYLQKKDLKGQYIHNKEIFRLRPTFDKGLRFVFSYINLIRPISDVIFLLISYIAIFTKIWLLLIIPSVYIAVLVVGSALLNSTKKQPSLSIKLCR